VKTPALLAEQGEGGTLFRQQGVKARVKAIFAVKS
jgi:hypothetical protein